MAEKIKNWIRFDKIMKLGHIDSVVHETEELLNMQFVNLGTVINTAEGEEVSIEFTAEGAEPDAYIGNPSLNYGWSDYDELTEVIPAGKPARAMHPFKGDIISFTDNLAVGVEVGDELAVGANGLGLKKAEEDEFVVAKVIDKNYMNNVGDLIVIRFV